jgi:tetratricopeptide (TPR) repeat protein
MPQPHTSSATTLNVPQVLAQAVELHQQGRLADAERLYTAILAVRPDQFDALHYLGVIKLAQGQPGEALQLIATAMRAKAPSPQILFNQGLALNALNRPLEALESFDHAIKLKTKFPEAHNNRGVLLAALGRDGEALESYRKALAITPNYIDALSNRGACLTKLKRFDEALASYDRAIVLKPDYVDAFYNRGVALEALQRFGDALASYDRALALRPDFAEALCSRGSALCQLKQFDQALASFDRALTLKPDHAEALYNRGIALEHFERFDEALASYDRALMLLPNLAAAHSNRAGVLRHLKRFGEALESCDRALALQPNLAQALSTRGSVLNGLKRYDEALASYDRALAVWPDNAEIYFNRAHTLTTLKRFDDASANYDRAIALRPDYANAHLNDALVKLLTGDFARGWEKYEWRLSMESVISSRRHFPQPLWLGEEIIRDKTILIHSEQGFGDAIQFCRFVPLVSERAARVIFEVGRPLRRLMADFLADFAPTAQVIARGDPLPDFDVQVPILSLPLAFRTRLETIPAATPYLHAPPPGAKNWDARIGPRTRPRIGLAWSGNAENTRDRERSISLRQLFPLLDVEATFVSLQKDVRADDAATLKERGDILQSGDELEDFSDTAALISQLDLVISVDTSVAHLAGALGKPAWIMVTYIPDWRWLLDRDDSPWYPTARLFRQANVDDWEGVIARVHDALRGFNPAS